MPFTANKQFKAKPRLLASASGMYYKDVDGNEEKTLAECLKELTFCDEPSTPYDDS